MRSHDTIRRSGDNQAACSDLSCLHHVSIKRWLRRPAAREVETLNFRHGREESGKLKDSAEHREWSTIEGIVAGLYGSISFAPGDGPDWERLRSLFHPDGRLIPPASPAGSTASVLDVTTWCERSEAYIDETGLREKGFLERELGKRTERFGKVAHVMSAYESLHAEDGGEPFSRGVNSIQLLREDDRWWILAIAWDVETDEQPIPEEWGTTSNQ